MPFDSKLELRTLRSPTDWIIASFLACVIAFLALGSHDVAIARLGVPYPDEGGVPDWAKYLGQVVRLATMVYAYRLAGWRLDQMGIAKAALTFGVLVILLQETLRTFIVDNIVSDGWINHRWISLLMSRLPSVLSAFYNGAVAVLIARALRHRSIWAIMLAVLLTTAINFFALLPGLKGIAGWVDASFHLTEAPEVHKPPYGFYVYKYIYSTFIEPTIACFVMAYLIWPSLKGSTPRRAATFVVLMLLMRGRIIATALFSFWIKVPWLLKFVAEGQFFVETLVMATLSAIAWAHLSKPAVGQHSVC